LPLAVDVLPSAQTLLEACARAGVANAITARSANEATDGARMVDFEVWVEVCDYHDVSRTAPKLASQQLFAV
jgi:hypothetical protein